MTNIIVTETFTATREYVVQLQDGESYVDACEYVRKNADNAVEVPNSLDYAKGNTSVYTFREYRKADETCLMVKRAERVIEADENPTIILTPAPKRGSKYLRRKKEKPLDAAALADELMSM